jgi:hypothetical protein
MFTRNNFFLIHDNFSLYKKIYFGIFTVVPCIMILSKLFSLTETQENRFKSSVKIYMKTAATCYGAITIIRERII